MPKPDPRVQLFGEVFDALLRERKLPRSEIERRMGRAKGYLYRGFNGFQGLSLENLLHALDAAEIPFAVYCERLYRATNPNANTAGLAIVPMAQIQEMIANAVGNSERIREAREERHERQQGRKKS
jgi:transcriptional regulator with XRE-family HTH domain